MSIQYDEEIFSNKNIVLKANFSGIDNSIVNAQNLTMSFYAYNKQTGQPIFSEKLNLKQVRDLYKYLNQISIIKDSSKDISGKFTETTNEVLKLQISLKHINSENLKLILEKLNDEEEIKIEDIAAAQKHKAYKTELKNLKQLLDLEEKGNIVKEIKEYKNLKPYIAKQPEKIFQNWIERNNLWIFGVEYIKHNGARKIALFSEADLLMESMDGFLDLIELKRPKYDIFKYDDNHKSYYPSEYLSKVIGQSLLYLQKMDEYKLILEKEHKVKILKPRIKIITGRTNKFKEEQFNALRMLNSNLNHIQIISYDYLLSCGEKVISNYS